MFIFVFSLVFGLIVEGVGEDVFAALGRMGFFQPVVAALVGLIPNCAASVLLTQLCGGSPPLFQSGGGAVHRRRRGPGRSLAGKPLLEAEPLYHRPDLGRRCRCGCSDTDSW